MSTSLLALLADSTAKAVVVFAVAGLAALALRRRMAAARHLVWSVAVAGTAILPVLSAVLPGWQIPVPSAGVGPTLGAGPAPVPGALQEPDRGPSGGIALVAQVPDGRRWADPSPRPQAFGLVVSPSSETVAERTEVPLNGHALGWLWSGSLALWAWVVGLVASGVPVVAGFLSLRGLARGSEPVTDPATLDLARLLAGRLGLKRPVRLVRSLRREIPMTWGIVRPVILLPADSKGWSEERLTMVLLHELAHVKRWDCLTQLVARSSCVIYWFNPLSWLALGRVRVEQEQACDDLALECGLDRVRYAHQLLAIVAGRPSGRPCSAVSMAMAATATLEGRLRGILDVDRDRRSLGRRTVVLASAASTALLLPLAAFSPRAESAPSLAAPTGPDQDAEAQKAKNTGIVEAEVLEKLRTVSVKPPDEETLHHGAIKGMLEALKDPYSEFLDAGRWTQLEKSLQSKVTGIGAQLAVKDGRVSVITPLAGSPALKAGIRPDDFIDAVDGKPTRGVNLTEVVKWILGEAGQVVKLKVEHADGRTEELAVTRGSVTLRNVLGARLDDEGRWDFLLDPDHAIGYIQLRQFTGEGVNELKSALQGLNGQGMKGLILDLRGAAGGLMSAAVESAQLFLSKGTVVSIRGRDGVAKVIKVDAEAKAPAADVPLVVLADGTTASAAEVVAGTLKDNDRAVVLGSRTFGKGSIQTIVKLDGNLGALKVTSAYYELPVVGNIERREGKATWGVDPSDGYYVPVNASTREAMLRKRVERERIGLKPPAAARAGKVTPESIETELSDPQLAAALRALIARTTRGAFEKVGLPASELTVRLKQLEDARKRKLALLEDLKKVDQQVDELMRNTGDDPDRTRNNR
jgi:carboxyl-terminal processing protease